MTTLQSSNFILCRGGLLPMLRVRVSLEQTPSFLNVCLTAELQPEFITAPQTAADVGRSSAFLCV